MPTRETVYLTRFPHADLLEREVPVRLLCPVYLDGALVEPESATYRLLSPAGAELLSETPDIEDGVAQLDVAALSTYDLAEGYTSEWTLVLDGETRVFRNAALVVLHRLACPIAEPDIYAISPRLNGAAADAVSARTSYQNFIEEAWRQIQDKLVVAGRRPYLVTEPSALRTPALLLAVCLIEEDLSTRNNAYQAAADRHRREFRDAWNACTFRYAVSPSTPNISGARRRAPVSPVTWLGRG